MKATRLLTFLLLCMAIGFADMNAEAGWKSFKKKIEKKVNNDDKKKDQKASDGKLYIENFGTGARKTGGTCAWIDLKTLNDNDNLEFKCVSGDCKTLTVHGRTSRGSWKTLYQGRVKEINVGEILRGKRRSYTHLVISVNGAHERYTRTAAKMEVIKTAAKTESIQTVKNEAVKTTPAPVMLKLNKSLDIYVGNIKTGTEYAYIKFSVTKAGTNSYRVNVLDQEKKGSVYDQLFSDPKYSNEIKGKGGWDIHPMGGSLHYRHYQLRKGTYYLRLKNDSKKDNGKVKVSVNVFEFNPQWANER